MDERKLPVSQCAPRAISSVFIDATTYRNRFTLERVRETDVEYIPRPVVDAIVAELEQMFRAAHELPADPYFEGKADAYDAALVIIDKRLKSYAEPKEARGE